MGRRWGSAFLLLAAGALFGGCPELPDHGAKILSVQEFVLDELFGKTSHVICWKSRDGEAEGCLTDTQSHAGDPHWRSDGDRILYAMGNAIMIMDEDGGNKQTILDQQGNSHLSFSADEKSVFFTKYDSANSVQAWRVPLTGGTPELLLSNISDFLSVAPVTDRLVYGRVTTGLPPDGMEQKLAIYSSAADGSGEVELGGEYADGIAVIDMAPDGDSALLFMLKQLPPGRPSWEYSYPCVLAVIRLDGSGNPGVILDNLQQGSEMWGPQPKFNADGTRLVHVEGDKLVTLAPDGTGRQELALPDGTGPSSAWFDPADQGRLWFQVQSLPKLGFTNYGSGAASLKLDGSDLRYERVALPHRDAYQPGR